VKLADDYDSAWLQKKFLDVMSVTQERCNSSALSSLIDLESLGEYREAVTVQRKYYKKS
jgi:hypothetical protein